MNWYAFFYLLTVIDSFKDFLGVIVVLSAVFWIVTLLFKFLAPPLSEENFDDYWSEKWLKAINRMIWGSFSIFLITALLSIFLPNKKSILLIAGGGGALTYLTQDSTGKQIPKEITNFVVAELKTMANDAKVELNLSEQKEKIMTEVKNMNADELLTKAKSDTVYKKILLEALNK